MRGNRAFGSNPAAGRLVLNVFTSVGQWEREAQGEGARDALAHVRSEGVRLGGEGLGWRRAVDKDRDRRRIVENVPGELETLTLVHHLRREGRSLRSIGAALEEELRPTKRGGR